MIRSTVALAAALLAAGPALAVTDPTPGAGDSRVRTVNYDPKQVTRLYSTGLVPLQLVFDADEKPVSDAGVMVENKKEDAKDWYAHASGNTLMLQPLHQMESSVLFVRTKTADGRDRYYPFELHTREGSITDPADKSAYMMVTWKYPPPPPTPEAIVAWRARRDQLLAARAEASTNALFIRAKAQAPRNGAYEKDPIGGCPTLAPKNIYDDGHRLTLEFAPDATVPQIYMVTPDHKLAQVMTINETTADGLQVVVPILLKDMRLIRGGKSCAIRPKEPEHSQQALYSAGIQPGGATGTVSPNVIRRARAP